MHFHLFPQKSKPKEAVLLHTFPLDGTIAFTINNQQARPTMDSNAGSPPRAPDGQPPSHAEPSSAVASPVVRLDSLSKRGRGSAPLKVKPKATVRRSLLEREQAEQEERSRLAAQNAAAHSPAGRGQRGKRWTRAPGMFGTRGGTARSYAMPPSERQGIGMASGPFGAGSIVTGMFRAWAGLRRSARTT